MKKTMALFVFLIFVVSLCVGGAAFFLKIPYAFWDTWLPVERGAVRTVVLKPGLNARQCAQIFEEQGALKGSGAELARWMARFGIDRKIRPGQYTVYEADAWNLARQLKTTHPAVETVVLVPGADIFSAGALFEERETPSPPESGDLLVQALLDDNNYPEPMRGSIPTTEEGRLAFLLPETYFTVERTPGELVRAASAAWWKRFAGTLSPDVTSQDLLQRATVASMIQREALWDDERAVIAGVIENRLDKGMLLQIDATVVYAWKIRGKNLTRVLHSDLTLDSPYNTYVRPGLPPAPICVPSVASWLASFAPEENAYFYYVARRDGRHYFSQNYEEHRRNIKKARTE